MFRSREPGASISPVINSSGRQVLEFLLGLGQRHDQEMMGQGARPFANKVWSSHAVGGAALTGPCALHQGHPVVVSFEHAGVN